MNSRDYLIRTAIENQGSWIAISKSLAKQKPVSSIIQIPKCITIYDENYPEQFRNLRYPPWVLFYVGNIQLLKQRCITIIGSREISRYGETCTKLSASVLSKKYVIVSGLAKGADAIAHRTAIENCGKTIGIIASGLQFHYPKENEELYQIMQKDHLILSEYPLHTPIRKHHFVWRNRLLAALGEKCIITSAKCKSGTMLTVNEAISLDKEVWCFPYPFETIEGKGCNKLIAEGAMILYDTIQLQEFL